MIDIPQLTARLLLAAVLGAVIGFDRERHTGFAGLRTHMLVCLGAALAMIVSQYAFTKILTQYPAVVLDPSRIAAQVISGIGFLGAGTIMFMRRENVIRGLTTAAGLWTVAAIGLAAGGGMYAAAAIATAIAWLILAALKPLERRFAAHRFPPQLRIGFAGRASLAAIERVLAEHNLPAGTIVTHHVPDAGDEVTLEFEHGFEGGALTLAGLADALRPLPGVESVSVDASRNGS